MPLFVAALAVASANPARAGQAVQKAPPEGAEGRGGQAESEAPPPESAADDVPASDPPPAAASQAATEDARQVELDDLRRRVAALEAKLREGAGAAPAPPAEASQKATIEKPPGSVSTPLAAAAGAGDSADNRTPGYAEGFHFGSYGRVVAAGDHRGRAGRDADIVAHGSRLDESTYAELELRREDYWEQTQSYTRVVATMAFAAPVFHYNADFSATLALRNLYLEESGLGLKKLKVWAGSRMYRGDDIYLLNFWPLDNLNTLGGGLSYEFIPNLVLRLHSGVNQPKVPFFVQDGTRPLPLGQVGATQVKITDRQKSVSSIKLSHIFAVGGSGGGIKPVVYAEVHYTPSGQRELETQRYQRLPADRGFVVGTQLGLFTGKRSSHLNLVFRYAGGLAAYGEFNAPSGLSPARTSKGALEMIVALSGNYEVGPFGLLFGAYWRSFRNATGTLDIDDLSEGIVIARPTVWFGDIAGLSIEGSYQAQQRGVLIVNADGGSKPLFAQVGRLGVVPFLTPGGRGNYVRPHLRLLYVLTLRDAGARKLYPVDDVFALRKHDHFIGLGAEWWFGSTSYFRD